MGASVLHEESILPVKEKGIALNIRNTNRPEDPGTMIVKHVSEEAARERPITGIAGHKGYSVISIEKSMMNSEVGFGRKVLQVLEDRGISFEHMPTGIDSMCVVVQSSVFEPHRSQVLSEIEKLVEGSGSVSVSDNLSIIATVTLLMGIGFFLMARKGIWIPCIILAVVWVCHIVYFVFRVKTISREEQEAAERENV